MYILNFIYGVSVSFRFTQIRIEMITVMKSFWKLMRHTQCWVKQVQDMNMTWKWNTAIQTSMELTLLIQGNMEIQIVIIIMTPVLPLTGSKILSQSMAMNTIRGKGEFVSGQLSVSGERMCTILVNLLEDSACPVNMWLGKLTTHSMTLLGWMGCKTSTQTNNVKKDVKH